MKRLILLFFMLGSLVTVSTAQSVYKTATMKPIDCYSDDYTSANPVPFTETAAYYLSNRQRPTTGSNRALTFQKIGSSGNLFTILNAEINRLDANNDLNTVTFIHRADQDTFPSSNVGQYTYGVSFDSGNTWDRNNGILNPSGNNVTLAGRFPNISIYNPIGNTVATNAYISYLGAWLPFAAGGADWEGFFHGVAKLDNNPATFTEDTIRPNNGDVSVASGLCQSVPGIFWAVDWMFDGTSFTGIILYRGVWNPATNDVEWTTFKTFNPGFDLSVDGNSQATGINMAFDRTGQYGWIAFTGDVTAGGENVFNPGFYRTTDGGVNWTGPIVVDLATLDNVQNNLIDPLVDVPTTAFDLDLVVDVNGNPHLGIVIGSAGADAYSIISNFGISIYDITRTPGAPKGCEWTAILLDSLDTFRGEFTTDVSEDNRPQASISPDGTKVIFGWLDSDPNATPNADNIAPDLHTRAIDVNTGLASIVENQTTGTLFDAAALFASFSPNALQSGNTLEVPMVVAELNPITLSDADPAYFYYGKGLDYDVTSEFVDDVYPPLVTLNGANPMTVVQNTSYTELGATALDNVDGSIGFGSFSVSGTVDVSTVGTYTLFYTVTDAAGNVSCSAARTVNVVASPDATPPTIALNGSDTIQLDVCQFFSDPGATANDNVDGDISGDVVVSGSLPTGTSGNPGTPGTYTLTYTSTDGAGNSASVVRVVVISDLAPAITLLGGDTVLTEVCKAYNDPGYFAYDNCLGSVTVTVNSTVDTLVPGSYTETYTATDGANTSTATRTVIVTPDVTPPTLAIVPGTNTVYVYLNDTYNDVLPTADDCAGIASLVSDASTSVNVTSYGTYTVTYTATDNNGNSADITRTVIVGTEPDPRFSYDGVSGLTYSFDSDSSLYGPTQWTWRFCDGGGSNSPNPNYTFISTGPCEICLTVTNQFNFAPFNKPAKTLCDTVNITVGIEEAMLNLALAVYPNPTTGKLNLEVRGMNFDNMSVDVFSTVGELIYSVDHTKVDAQSRFSMDITGAASGIYLVRISTEHGVITKRVTLQSGF